MVTDLSGQANAVDKDKAANNVVTIFFMRVPFE
jgi:hypothetical protein